MEFKVYESYINISIQTRPEITFFYKFFVKFIQVSFFTAFLIRLQLAGQI